MELAQAAHEVLDENWLGNATRPGPRLYPHQWSWDSAFTAIGWSHVEWERASTELRTLFAAQWPNGLLPHIVFHDGAGDYFPGPAVWDTPHDYGRPATSGIVQPPIHATAARMVADRAPTPAAGRAFLAELFGPLRAWHDYLYRERDPEGEGLAAMRHPWESGQDDSPAWDGALAAIPLDPTAMSPYRRVDLTLVHADERPDPADYDHYVQLIECFKRHRYDEAAMRADCPFWVVGPLFNSLLALAGEDLARSRSGWARTQPRSGPSRRAPRRRSTSACGCPSSATTAPTTAASAATCGRRSRPASPRCSPRRPTRSASS